MTSSAGLHAVPAAAAKGLSNQPVCRLAWFPPTTGVNPYQEILYRHLGGLGVKLAPEPVFSLRWLWRARREVNLLHFHWRLDRYYDWPHDWSCWHPPAVLRRPLAWVKLVSFLTRLVAARLLGYRIVWTIHDVLPKVGGSRRLHLVAAITLARLSNVLLAHDLATAERARVQLGRSAARVEVVPHGSYVGFYPPRRTRAEVRKELGIPPEAFAYVSFGVLRAEKEIELLLEAFAALDRDDVALVVAGEVREEEIGAEILAASRADSRIKPLLAFVPEEQVGDLFSACDAAALPRGNGWTSGSLILALSMGLPVIAADTRPYRELTGGEAAGWLFRPGDARSLRAALEAAAADRALAAAKGEMARRRAELLSWSDSAARTLAAMLGTSPKP